MSQLLVDLLDRAGAHDVISDPTLRFVLDLLDVQEPRARVAAGVAYQDRPIDALALACGEGGVVEALDDNERVFAESSYDVALSDGIIVADPEPLGRVLGIHTTLDLEPPPPPPTSVAGNYGLFPHQRRAVIRAARLLAAAESRVLIHMPTGSGKTRSAMNLVAEHLRSAEPTMVIWAASTKELLAQAAWEFSYAWQALGNRRVAIGQGWDGATQDEGGLIDGFLAATLQGLNQLKQTNPAAFEDLANRCTFMVFDEAHQAIAPTYWDVTEAIADRARLLGLSATPGRTAEGRTEADRNLAEFFTNRKVILDTSNEGTTNPVRYLINAGYLAEPQFRVVPIDRDPTTYDGSSIAAGVDPAYVSEVVRLVRRLCDHEDIRRPMLFAGSVAEARLIAAASTAIGIPGRYVAGAMPKQVRADAIDWFKDNADEPRLLANYNVLSTGFDSPKVDASIIARPTQSLVLYSQMVGRAIRGPAAGGTPDALVITVVASDNPAFSDIAQAFVNWENNWKLDREDHV